MVTTDGGSDRYLPIDVAKHPMGKEYRRLYFDEVAGAGPLKR
jgi:hypothetical protein